MQDHSVYCPHGPHQWPVASSGPLQGLRFVYKDLYDVAGYTTGAGNPTWYASHAPAAMTAPVLDQLFQSGAVCVGRVQTDELAYSLNGANAHFGTPVNPKTPERLPGGSSSGSAVAVAAGEAEIGLGTDTGGSVRIPAMYNGLYGIRPTHGRLPTGGLVPLAPRFDTPGWLCKDAPTLERVGSHLFGLPAETLDLNQIQLVMLTNLFARLPQQLRASWEQFKPKLEKLLTLQSWDIPAESIDPLTKVFQTLQGRQAGTIHRQWHQQHPQALAADIDARLSWAEQMSESQQAEAEQARLQWLETLSGQLHSGRFLLLPTGPDTAPLRDTPAEQLADFRMRLMGMTAMAGLSGCPQVHLPLLETEGVPFGFSLIGPRDSDMQLLALARLIAAEVTHD